MWGNAMKGASDEAFKAAKKAATVPLFTSDQFKNAPKPGPALPGEHNKPMLGSNAVTDASKEIQKAIEDFNKAELAAANMQKILGDSFDVTGAEIDRTTKLLNVLASNGVEPADRGFGGLQERLARLTNVIKPVEDASKTLAKTLGSEVASAAVTMNTGLETATTRLDLLKQEQAAVSTAMKKYDTDVLRSTQAYHDLTIEYLTFADAIADETKVQTAIDVNKALAKSLKEDLAVGALTGATALDQLKKQQSSALEAFTNLQKVLDENDPRLKEAEQRYRDLTAAVQQAGQIQSTADAFRDLGEAIRASVFEESIHAITAVDKLKKQQQALAKAMNVAIFNKDAEALKVLRQQYEEVTAAIKLQTAAMIAQALVADFLAEALGAALQGGIHQAASIKAKQLGIEAAEMAVRAFVFAAFGNFEAAGAAATAAVQYGALALAWAGLAASTGGGSSTSVSVPSGGSVSNSGEDLTQARTSSGRSASDRQAPSAEVSIYMVGPGFNALNPKVQRVVWGATQEARQRYGNDAVIRIRNEGE